jgi:hypothetical protein
VGLLTTPPEAIVTGAVSVLSALDALTHEAHVLLGITEAAVQAAVGRIDAAHAHADAGPAYAMIDIAIAAALLFAAFCAAAEKARFVHRAVIVVFALKTAPPLRIAV